MAFRRWQFLFAIILIVFPMPGSVAAEYRDSCSCGLSFSGLTANPPGIHNPQVGDEITFSVLITNSGDVPVTLANYANNFEPMQFFPGGVFPELSPGDTYTLTTTYPMPAYYIEAGGFYFHYDIAVWPPDQTDPDTGATIRPIEMFSSDTIFVPLETDMVPTPTNTPPVETPMVPTPASSPELPAASPDGTESQEPTATSAPATGSQDQPSGPTTSAGPTTGLPNTGAGPGGHEHMVLMLVVAAAMLLGLAALVPRARSSRR